MKKPFCALMLLSLLATGAKVWAKEVKSTTNAEAAMAIKDDKSKVSYGIGVDIGKNFKRLALDVDLKVLMQGLQDGYAGNKLQIPNDELGVIMSRYQNELKEKQLVAMKSIGETNLKAGETFLAENGKKDGVVTLPSGLQYKILKKGEGKIPGQEDMVECNYSGRLLDGTEFDSSARVGHPALFKVSGVIPGWQEALKLMPVGSKWQIFIPGKLAYGERGAGREIGPNATLVFEVELLNIKTSEVVAIPVPAAGQKSPVFVK